MNIKPFSVHISQKEIDDLNERLSNTRWAPEFDNRDWSQGVNGTYLRNLVDYWKNGFDWRAQERLINNFPQYQTEIDGVPIHFIHVRGKGPNPLPIILNHGWPWSFWDFKDVILPLADPAAFGGDPADAFDVVVPSLPGFAFSGPSPRSGIGYVETADMWVQLMHQLGYKRFVTHGGDAGAFISGQLGSAHSESIVGVHLTFPILPGVPVDAGQPEDFTEEERVMASGDQERAKSAIIHSLIHKDDPQTLAWAMHDSPVGLAAWLLLRRRAWSDCHGDVEASFDKDTLLTHFSIYWFTNCFLSSQLFCQASDFPEVPKIAANVTPKMRVPTAIAVMPKDLMHRSRNLLEAQSNLHRYTILPRGGHFAAGEEPELITDDIRAFVRPLRSDHP